MDRMLSRAAAAALLGVPERRVRTMLADGVLRSRRLDDVLEAREQRWVTTRDAARLLSVNRSRVGQLVEAGRLPCHQSRPKGLRWFRYGQLTVIANARAARALQP